MTRGILNNFSIETIMKSGDWKTEIWYYGRKCRNYPRNISVVTNSRKGNTDAFNLYFTIFRVSKLFIFMGDWFNSSTPESSVISSFDL